MDRDTALSTLRIHQRQLEQLGVSHIALFGSVARGEHTAKSDVDLLVEVDPDASIGVFEYVGILEYLQTLFPVAVDVSNKAKLKPHIRPSAEQSAIYAF